MCAQKLSSSLRRKISRDHSNRDTRRIAGEQTIRRTDLIESAKHCGLDRFVLEYCLDHHVAVGIVREIYRGPDTGESGFHISGWPETPRGPPVEDLSEIFHRGVQSFPDCVTQTHVLTGEREY